GLLKEKIMRFCIGSLLKLETKEAGSKLPVYYDTGDTDMDEEDHEAICSMFTTIGKTIDRPPAAEYMKVCFGKIAKLSTDKSLPSRSRFMYKDLLDLRSNNWVPRRKEEKAKTLEEIRKDFERDEARAAQQSAQLHSGHSGYRGGGGRGGGDYRNQGRGGGGGGSRQQRQSRPVAQTDDDGFTSVVGGGGGGRRGGGSSLAQAASQPNRILSRPNQGGGGGAGGFSALADAGGKPRPEPLDKDKFERRVKTILSEYIQDPSNISELMLAMEELTGTEKYGETFVSVSADHIIDCKENERQATYEMMGILVEKKQITPNDVKAGLADLVEFIDSYVCDDPRAYEYLGNMLATMIRTRAIDMSWVAEQAEKTKLSDPTAAEKIIRGLVNAIKNDKRGGADAVKNAFGPHQDAMNKLLGASTWDAVKKEV
ncbi:MAG: hypothetical protein SGARI_005247, partial [Bacillariaceae sp.]